MFTNINTYLTSFAISILMGISLNSSVIHAQIAIPDTPTLKYYFPYSNGTISTSSYGIGMHKWYSLNDTTINFYVIPLGEKLSNGTDIAWDVFSKAVQVWNNQNIGVHLNLVGFAQTGDSLHYTKAKNLLGFGNIETNVLDKDYGATKAYNTKHVVYANNYQYKVAQNVHVELNIDQWKNKALVLQTPSPTPVGYKPTEVLNVYAVAVHELGHVLGLKENCGGIQSIMGTPWEDDSNAYNVLGTNALPERDKLMIHALYPKITSGRESETRLPK